MTQVLPLALLAELTHRCPLACPYCSNPLELDRRSDELDTKIWLRVFEEAAELGILHLHLSGGEPGARHDLEVLVEGAAQRGLYTNLITSGIGIGPERLDRLVDAGLDHVQLSIQDTEEGPADRIAGYRGAHRRKLAFANGVCETGLPLTINVVVHRGNIGRVPALVRQAQELGARRVEIAHAQYYGWGLKNRSALMPDREAALGAGRAIEVLQSEMAGRIVIDYVPPDYFARFPKPCVNGWGRRSLNVTPRGKVLPCHAAETIPGLEFWNVADHSLASIWHDSPSFNAFRGTGWMADECKACPRRDVDFGGCRCQAMALTGDARNADPACMHSPYHHLIKRGREEAMDPGGAWEPRRLRTPSTVAS